jgi:hypothetical protein
VRKRGLRTLTRAEALPCPFCGEQPTIEPWHGGGPKKRMVSCPGEDATGYQCFVTPSVSGGSAEVALKRWNWRKTR